MRRVLLACAMSWCLSGCLMGPDYERPEVETPTTWRFEDKDAKDVANTAWWEQFDDPILNDLILAALQENKDVKIATARVEDFLGQLQTTRAALFPQVNAGASAGQQQASEVAGPLPQLGTIPGHQATFGTFNAGLSVGWEIDVWGKIRRATEAARANLLGTDEARRSVILTLVTSVATSYVTLRELDRQLEVTRRTAQSYKQAYDIFTLRFQYGVVSDLELNQAKSQYEAALANIPFFEKAIAQQENALSGLLGRNPGPIPRGRTIDALVRPAVPSGLPSEILTNRPDVRQAEQALIAANANIGVAKALYFPSISLTGLFGFSSSELSKLFSAPAATWSYAASLTAPIFTAGAIAGQVKSAEGVQQAALFQYLQIIQTAFREVDDALVDQQRTREQLAALAEQISALRNYANLAWLRYEEGYASYLEVVYAENQLYSAEIQFLDVQGTVFRALVDLYKAMGGGWVMEAERAASANPGGTINSR